MSFTCELQQRPAQPALIIRGRAPQKELGSQMGQAIGAISQYLAQLNAKPAGSPFAVYYNEDPHDFDFATGFPVSESLPARPPIEASEIPAGAYAVCTFTGPYSKLGEGYAALDEWCRAHNYVHDVVAYELYLNSPADTPAAELRTLIMRPVRDNNPSHTDS